MKFSKFNIVTVIREFDFAISAMMACIEMLLDHNVTCRQSILGAVRNLTSEEFTKELGVGNDSICNILVHMINAEDYWISLLRETNARKFNPNDFDKADSIEKIWSEVETATKEVKKKKTKK